jgi:phospholipid/cholesterol/gamma-HCH transport system substrate-binding protein
MQILLNSGDGPIYTLLENGKTITTKVDSLVDHVNVITNSLHQIVGKINSNEGTLGAMINDTKFYGELRSTISNADSLLSIIKKQGLDVNVDFF